MMPPFQSKMARPPKGMGSLSVGALLAIMNVALVLAAVGDHIDRDWRARAAVAAAQAEAQAAAQAAATAQTAMIAMKADLRNLVTAEEGFFSDSSKYTADVAALHLQVSVGVSVPTISTAPGYWTATVTHAQLPGRTCAIAVNTTNPLITTAGEGEPACQ